MKKRIKSGNLKQTFKLLPIFDARIAKVRLEKEAYIGKVRHEVHLGYIEPNKKELSALASARLLRTKEMKEIFYRNVYMLLRGLIVAFLLADIILIASLRLLPDNVGEIKVGYYEIMAQFFTVMLVALYVLPLIGVRSDDRSKSVKLGVLGENITGITFIVLGLITSMGAIAIGAGSTPLFIFTTVMFLLTIWLAVSSILKRGD